MLRRGSLTSLLLTAIAAASCSGGDDAADAPPRPQLVMIIDTDMPTASDIAQNPTVFAPAAAIDTVRVDVYPTGFAVEAPEARLFAVPDRQAWPISFGISKGASTASVLVRVRVFRASFALTTTAVESSAVPDPNVTVDRLVRLDLPASGVHHARVRLHGSCVGTPSAIVDEKSCVDADPTDPRRTVIGSSRDGVELDPPDRFATLVATWPLAKIVGCRDKATGDRKCIPGGLTILGDREAAGLFAFGAPFPLKPVYLSPFYIDRTEVTVAQYDEVERDIEEEHRAVNSTPNVPLREFCTRRNVLTDGKFPINCVDWEGARQVCVARGGSLPSEAQWERAARGLAMRSFPWGDLQPRCCTASIGREAYAEFRSVADCRAELSPVGGRGPEQVGSRVPKLKDCEHGDVTPEGVVDMGASMAELTLDSFLPYSHECWGVGLVHDPRCEAPAATPTHVTRGATWTQGFFVALSSLRHAGGFVSEEVGLRCVYPAKPAEEP